MPAPRCEEAPNDDDSECVCSICSPDAKDDDDTGVKFVPISNKLDSTQIRGENWIISIVRSNIDTDQPPSHTISAPGAPPTCADDPFAAWNSECVRQFLKANDSLLQKYVDHYAKHTCYTKNLQRLSQQQIPRCRCPSSHTQTTTRTTSSKACAQQPPSSNRPYFCPTCTSSTVTRINNKDFSADCWLPPTVDGTSSCRITRKILECFCRHARTMHSVKNTATQDRRQVVHCTEVASQKSKPCMQSQSTTTTCAMQPPQPPAEDERKKRIIRIRVCCDDCDQSSVIYRSRRKKHEVLLPLHSSDATNISMRQYICGPERCSCEMIDSAGAQKCNCRAQLAKQPSAEKSYEKMTCTGPWVCPMEVARYLPVAPSSSTVSDASNCWFPPDEAQWMQFCTTQTCVTAMKAPPPAMKCAGADPYDGLLYCLDMHHPCHSFYPTTAIQVSSEDLLRKQRTFAQTKHKPPTQPPKANPGVQREPSIASQQEQPAARIWQPIIEELDETLEEDNESAPTISEVDEAEAEQPAVRTHAITYSPSSMDGDEATSISVARGGGGGGRGVAPMRDSMASGGSSMVPPGARWSRNYDSQSSGSGAVAGKRVSMMRNRYDTVVVAKQPQTLPNEDEELASVKNEKVPSGESILSQAYNARSSQDKFVDPMVGGVAGDNIVSAVVPRSNRAMLSVTEEIDHMNKPAILRSGRGNGGNRDPTNFNRRMSVRSGDLGR